MKKKKIHKQSCKISQMGRWPSQINRNSRTIINELFETTMYKSWGAEWDICDALHDYMRRSADSNGHVFETNNL